MATESQMHRAVIDITGAMSKKRATKDEMVQRRSNNVSNYFSWCKRYLHYFNQSINLVFCEMVIIYHLNKQIPTSLFFAIAAIRNRIEKPGQQKER